jgi:predicted component of type VI protein secretion system
MLAIIGPRWAGGGGERTRIGNTTDPVRIELEKAFELGIQVVPVLVNNATMPDPNQLPESIRELSDRNAAFVDTGRDFHAHVDRLIRSLKQLNDNVSGSRVVRVRTEPPLSTARSSEVAPKPAQNASMPLASRNWLAWISTARD